MRGRFKSDDESALTCPFLFFILSPLICPPLLMQPSTDSPFHPPSLSLESGANVAAEDTPSPVWTLRIPMASVVCVNLLLQIITSALTFPGRRGQRGGNSKHIIRLIAQMVVNALTITLYCLVIYPSTFTSNLMGAWYTRTCAGSRRATRLIVVRILVVATLAWVYLYFVAQSIYDLSTQESQFGFGAWVILMLNISMVVMLAFDYRIHWRHKQAVHDPQQRRESPSTLWAQTQAIQDDLPPYEGRVESGTATFELQMEPLPATLPPAASEASVQEMGESSRNDQVAPGGPRDAPSPPPDYTMQ